MTGCMLPASPVWYCSRVVDSNDSGLLCFGAKHSIYILDTDGGHPRFKAVISVHEDRVVGVSFCTGGEQNKVCSVSEDGKVKIWNVVDGLLCAEHAEHKDKLTSVHWSPADPDLIVSGDDKGNLVIWHPDSGDMKMICPEHSPVFCLSCSPHIANHVAVGYKNGHVLLLDISKKENSVIVKKFKGHDDEIHSIMWCPKPCSQLNWRQSDSADTPVPEDGEDYLLATSSRDKTIRVWCLSQNKPVCLLKLPQTGQRRGWADAKQRLWVTLYWSRHKTNELVCSSFNGELLLWDLASSERQQTPKHFTGRNECRAHTRIVFNLTPVGKDATTLCSISMDRNLIFWDLQTLTTKHVISSCGGSVYCLAQSPIHPGRLAIGVGDNLVRVWNVENSQKPYDVTVYWQGIKSKVTAVSWHPVKEGQLAFGTEDGKVGILDILSSRSQGSSTYHNRTVYVVTWGPPSYTKGDRDNCSVDYVVYSCGDSTVLQHNPTKLQDNALDINSVIRETNNMQGKLRGRSEISWKPDYSVVALGNEDGTIEIFKAGTLQILCSVQVHRRLVNVVRWHPEYTDDNVDPSQYQFWIASGSNEAVICVTDLRKSLELMDKDEKTSPVVVTESFCQLEGHTDRITGLSWSSHHQGYLVSASYDWTAQVWDVNKAEPLANYRGHHGRLLCAVWSGLDADVVYTGSDDFAVHCWKISQQKHKTPPTGSEKRKNRGKNRGTKPNIKPSIQSKQAEASVLKASAAEAEQVPVGVGAINDAELEAIQTLINEKKQELQQSTNESSVSSSVTISDQVLKSPEGLHLNTQEESSVNKERGRKEAKDKKKRKTRSLFPLSSTTDNRGKLQAQDDCVHLAQAKAKDPVPLLPEELCHLGHFLDRSNSFQMFNKEVSHHMHLGNWEQYIILETFRGDIGDSVRTLTEKQELNDFAVALSVMASPSTWQATCQAYATQLEKEGNYTKAATYLLAIHKVYDAIDLLQRSGHYKDAICLAQVRLSPEDPVIKSLYSAWGNHLASDGNYEHAAKCYIASDQPVEAARLLARRADTSALRVAAEICISCRDIGSAKVYCHKFVHQCLLNLDWASAAGLITMEPELKLYGLLVTAHQSLLQQLHLLGYIKDIDVNNGEPYTMKHKQTAGKHVDMTAIPWLLLKVSDVKGRLPWEPYTVEGEVFVHHLIRQWYCLWDMDMRKSSLTKLHLELITLSHARQAQTAMKQVLIEVTCYIAMATIDVMLNKDDDAAKWLTVAMETCYSTNLDDVWEGLCRLLLPAGPNRFNNFCLEVHAICLSAIPQENITTDQVTTGQRRQSITDQHTRTTDIEKIYNDSEECTPVDCLKAFYNLRALKYYLAEENLRLDATSQISANCIQDLAHSLLWNVQLRRLKLEEMILQISRAIAAQKGMSNMCVEVPPSIDCNVDQTLLYPATPEIKNVSLEAFKKGNEMIEIRQRKGHDASFETSEEEFVPMSDTGAENEKPGVDSANLEFDSTSKKDIALAVEDITLISANNVSSKGLTDSSEVDQQQLIQQVYPNVPEEWYTMPIDEKYKQSYIDLTILTVEHEFVQKELTSLKQKLKDVPFPNPEKSVMMLVKLCELCHDEGAPMLQEAMVEWAQTHCYTTEARTFFSKYKSTNFA